MSNFIIGYAVYQAKSKKQLEEIIERFDNGKELTEKEVDIIQNLESFRDEDTAKDFVKHHKRIMKKCQVDEDNRQIFAEAMLSMMINGRVHRIIRRSDHKFYYKLNR